MKRVAFFVDGNNMFYTQRGLGWSVDAKKLLDFCKQFGNVVEATYYAGSSGEESQLKFYDLLAHNGYSLVTKPIKNVGGQNQKANLDVELAIDCIALADRYDVAVIVSGDGDFEYAIRRLKSWGKEVKVVSTKNCVASELVRAVGMHYIDLLSVREQVERAQSEDLIA